MHQMSHVATKPFVRTIGLISAMLILSGCAAQMAAQNRETDQLLVTGNYAGAALNAESRMGLEPSKAGAAPTAVTFSPKHVLEHLEAAEAWRLAGNTDRSLAHYDAAESALTGVDNQNAAEGAARQAGAVLMNDTMITYRPSPAESVLINYYKSLIFWQQGNADNVRVELNRADDRIRRAVDRYAEEIAEATKVAAENTEKAPSNEKTTTAIADAIGTRFPEMSEWKPYQGFVVPPASYLQALYLGRSTDGSDLEKSRETMDRVVGITDNPVAAADLADLNSGRLCPADDCVWVIAEHGQGPTLVERRFDLPIPTSKGLVTLSMALPALESRTAAGAPPFELVYAGTNAVFYELASMDRIVQTEFQKRFPGIVTRATIGATVKAVAQHQINKEAGPLAGLMANLISAATTAADVRMWRSMPGRFVVSRLKRPADNRLVLRHVGGEEIIELPPSGLVLVHVKQPDPRVRPAYSAFRI